MCCTREAFRNLPASAARRCCCLRRAQHAASAELSTATIDTSRQLQRWLAATPASGRVVPRRFGSTQARRAPPTRRPLANLPSPPCTLPLRVGSPRACSRRRSERHAPDSCRCSSTGARSAGRALRADPQSALTQPLTHIHVLSSLRTTRKKTHEYCELFMIIRCLRIQSHDNLGADVFKLMIISVCCIQTQLIVFMPNAGVL